MKHFLKERGINSVSELRDATDASSGMIEWLKEYVIKRQERVEKLLQRAYRQIHDRLQHADEGLDDPRRLEDERGPTRAG